MGEPIGTDDTLAVGVGGGDVPTFPEVDPDHYTLGDEIARGGMGRIVCARDRRLGRDVAIKQLLGDSPEIRARFLREAKITARLAHPAIVSILEVGATAAGEPFYAMELVRGESLDKAIAARATFAARLALLPHVIAVADALAYVHAQHVIHRDLKPANVLVGAFGETVVIDWGLAKDLGDPDDHSLPPLKAAMAPARAPDATVDGSVMGTPAYMPAEQAMGDKVDARADVYALGAMLYHVLAGVPPYRGKTTDDILIAVLQGPPIALAERQDGVPADLVAIVDKAMAYDAKDRYPTAQGLVDDLKRFAAGKLVGAHHYSPWALARRFVRRHVLAFAIGGIAIVLLAALAIASVRRIVAERAAADASRGQAEDLMNFMMVDLRDELAPLHKLSLIDDMAHRAATYYAQRDQPATEAETEKRAQALANIGDVLRAEGDTSNALVEYAAALALRERLAAASPDDDQRQRLLQIVLDRVGDVHLGRAETAAAAASYAQSLAIAERVAARDPTPTHRRDLSISDNKLGDVLKEQGDRPGALAKYRAALAIREELARGDAGLGAARDLSTSYDRIAQVLVADGAFDEARALYGKGLAIAERVARERPGVDAQRDLAYSHAQLGEVYAHTDRARALAEHQQALELRKAIADGDPANAEWQRELTVSYDAVGDLYLERKVWAGAYGLYATSLAISRTLAARDPASPAPRRDVASGLANVATAALGLGDIAEATRELDEARAIREALLAADPRGTTRRRDVASTRALQARALAASGTPDGKARAAVELTAALAMLDALAGETGDADDRVTAATWRAQLAALTR